MIVIKRDGREVQFDKHKIIDAISKAMTQVGISNLSFANTVADKIEKIAQEDETPYSVEEIQDLVEGYLMDSPYQEVARAYIIYRNERTKAREETSLIIRRVRERIEAKNVQNSNANVDENSFSGREKEASSEVQKIIAVDYNMSPDVAKAQKDGLIYQHDMDKYNLGEHNCLNIDFAKLFNDGFITRNGDVRKPATFSTACQQVAVIFQCQSQVQFGGVGSVHIDFDLAPFVRNSFIKHYADGMKYIRGCNDDEIDRYKDNYKDVPINDEELYDTDSSVYKFAMDMLEREGKQSCEAFYHNLNTLESRQGSQVPFTSVNLGRDTSYEGRMVTRWMMNASINGIGKYHRTSIFPISIFQYKQGANANPVDKNYDLKQLALESLSKRIYPNWCNCDWSQAHEDPDNPDTFFSTMGCRTMLGYDRHGLGYTRVGRGNNVPITIILPKLGIEHGICLGKREIADFDGFWTDFEETLKLTEKALLERFDIMAKQLVSSAPFMYQNGTIKGTTDETKTAYDALKHNTLAIGYIGIAEMCQSMFGENHLHSQKALAFALEVVKRIHDFAIEASDRNDLNFSCYATPAEGLCNTAMDKLKAQYGIIPNVTEHEYLTNSHHVPVWEKCSIFEKLECEAPFCKYPTGGCITYVELESTFVHNVKAVENIIDYAFKTLDIPYLAFNFPIDTCLDCGFQGEMNEECQHCHGHNIQHLRRVTGYLTTDYRNFNKGKRAETEDRVKHSAYTKF